MDKLQLYRGRDVILLSDKDSTNPTGITLHSPTLGEICDYGESQFFSLAYYICSIPTDYMDELEDAGIKYEDFGKDFLGGNIDVLSSTMDVVGNYPARRIEYKMSAKRSGVTINIYGVNWIVFYEDVYVLVGGSVNTHDQNAMPMFGHMFDLITNNVRFYDQYNDKNYGK